MGIKQWWANHRCRLFMAHEAKSDSSWGFSENGGHHETVSTNSVVKSGRILWNVDEGTGKLVW